MIIPRPTPNDGHYDAQSDGGDIYLALNVIQKVLYTSTEEYLNRVSDNITTSINESIIAELLKTIQTLNQTVTDRFPHWDHNLTLLLSVTSPVQQEEDHLLCHYNLQT